MMVVSMVAKKQERAVAFGSQLRREGVARPSLLSMSDQLAVEVPYRARWRALTSGKRCSGSPVVGFHLVLGSELLPQGENHEVSVTGEAFPPNYPAH